MSKRKVVQKPESDAFKQFRWIQCEVSVAVNPVTRSEVTLIPPVVLGCYEDFARFNDQWDDFCSNSLVGDPTEVCFQLT